MELKKKVLFTIYERTVIKGRHCAITNIRTHLKDIAEFEGIDPNELSEQIILTVCDLMNEGILETIINPRRVDNTKICFEITPKTLASVADSYREDIFARIHQLDTNNKILLNIIFEDQAINHMPFVIDALSEEKQKLFDENIDKLIALGFVAIRDKYNLDDETFYCNNAIVTITGKQAYSILEQENEGPSLARE